MDQFLKKTEERILALVKEHSSGLLREIILYHLSKPGKMLRPKMIHKLGNIYGADLNELVEWAVALELFHNASLIHDDLQDADLVRRGQPSVWAKYGKKQAINAGDFLLMLSHRPLENIAHEKRASLQKLFSQASLKIVQGQSIEFQLNALEDIETLRETYLRCITLKTSALFSCLAQGAGILSGLDNLELKELDDLFVELGNIFQIQDDILDLFGDKKREEKGCDLKEGKVSFLVVNHFELHPDDPYGLKELLLKPRTSTAQNEVNSMCEVFARTGALQKSSIELAGLVARTKANDLLKRKPELGVLVHGLISKIIAPISHVDYSLKKQKEEARV